MRHIDQNQKQSCCGGLDVASPPPILDQRAVAKTRLHGSPCIGPHLSSATTNQPDQSWLIEAFGGLRGVVVATLAMAGEPFLQVREARQAMRQIGDKFP